MKNVSFNLTNYSKPTPAKLKAIADFLLASILLVDPLLQSIPNFEYKEWTLWGWNTFVVLFKFATKFTTEKR